MPRQAKQSNLETTIRTAGLDIRESRDLLVHVLHKPLSFLVAHPETILSTTQQRKFQALAKQRRRGVPFAYLTGQKGFYGLDFTVTKDVLIPRPETEQIVDWALAHINRKSPTTFVDVGTGSGCIAITLAKFLPQAHLIAGDISKQALLVAKKNARLHKVAKQISFRRGSLLSVLKSTEHPDLIIANLPYLTKPQLKNVPHEPKQALYGGIRGLELMEKLIQQIFDRGITRAILEIDPAQERWLTGIGDRLKGYQYEFLPDLSGRTRIMILKTINAV